MIEEFITFNGFIYKKVGDIGSMLKTCPTCYKEFFTKEQRKIYCCNACKTKNHRAKK
tara:strand:- start:272 stop:442 length:171 start_codon:yes stop_codon:yes gene_type:complete